MTTESLAHQILIAMPQMADPGFAQTVTLMIEHTDDGAMGLVINRPTDLSLADILTDLSITPSPDCGLQDYQVLKGGPVHPEAGFVLHPPTTERWQSTVYLTDQFALTTSKDILQALAAGQGPRQSLVILGYAGWAPGQLEKELADNAWLSAPATTELVFSVPLSQRWQAAARQLGVDIQTISTQAGHA